MNALRSISHSLVQVLTKLPAKDVPADLWRAARGILRALWHQGQHPELTNLRNAVCAQCPMFSEKWRTCGEPGEMTDGDAHVEQLKVGCWCYLPLANQDPKKDCWARANGLEHVGWPDALRPDSE